MAEDHGTISRALRRRGYPARGYPARVLPGLRAAFVRSSVRTQLHIQMSYYQNPQNPQGQQGQQGHPGLQGQPTGYPQNYMYSQPTGYPPLGAPGVPPQVPQLPQQVPQAQAPQAPQATGYPQLGQFSQQPTPQLSQQLTQFGQPFQPTPTGMGIGIGIGTATPAPVPAPQENKTLKIPNGMSFNKV